MRYVPGHRLGAFGGLNAYLWQRTGRDRIPVIVYSAAVFTMSLVALDSGSPKTAAGGALFLVSDSLLALEKFGGVQLPAGEGMVMATYASAQARSPGKGPGPPAAGGKPARARQRAGVQEVQEIPQASKEIDVLKFGLRSGKAR